MLERELEIEPQPSFHRLIYSENDVLSQVVSQLLNPHRNFILIRADNLFNVRHARVACASKIDFTGPLDRLVSDHPHRKNKLEPGVLLPETRHVPNVQSLPWKRHA